MSIGVRTPYLGVHIPQGVAFDPTTSYATGDRRQRIVYSNSAFFASGTAGNLIDGLQTDVAFFSNGQPASSHNIKFDFGYQYVIDEFKWYQSGSTSQGTWKMQASNDDSAYTDIGSSFTLGTPATQTVVLGGITPYRYWRLQGVSGTTSSGPYVREIEFKISAPANSPGTVWATGDRTASITLTKSAGITILAGTLPVWIDGNNTTSWRVTIDPCVGQWVQFDLGSSRVIDAAIWRWAATGSWGTWKWQGSGDASSWSDISGAFDVPGNGVASYSVAGGLFESLMYFGIAANRTAYRYYRLLGVSGNMNGTNLHEIEFRTL